MNKINSDLFYEANYDTTDFGDLHRSVWIFPITQFVLGRYPKNIYLKVCSTL